MGLLGFVVVLLRDWFWVVPRQHLEAIGLSAQGTRVYGLEDGSLSGWMLLLVGLR